MTRSDQTTLYVPRRKDDVLRDALDLLAQTPSFSVVSYLEILLDQAERETVR